MEKEIKLKRHPLDIEDIRRVQKEGMKHGPNNHVSSKMKNSDNIGTLKIYFKNDKKNNLFKTTIQLKCSKNDIQSYLNLGKDGCYHDKTDQVILFYEFNGERSNIC